MRKGLLEMSRPLHFFHYICIAISLERMVIIG